MISNDFKTKYKYHCDYCFTHSHFTWVIFGWACKNCYIEAESQLNKTINKKENENRKN